MELARSLGAMGTTVPEPRAEAAFDSSPPRMT